MKAAVYYVTGPPSVLRYEEVPDPVCHPRGVVIKVQAVSIEGGDVLNRAGGAMTARPHIVGYQAAGVVREAGAEVTDRRVGQRVVGIAPNGSHAELFSLPAASTWVVPDGMDIAVAACVPIAFGTADDCLFEFGRLKAGESVLIQAGAGGVGLAAIQLAKRAGATVFATASSDEKLARLKEFGVDYGINYRERDFVEEVKRLTSGRGVDLVVDSVGGAVLQGSLRCLAYKGRAISVGSAGRDRQQPDLSLVAGRNCSYTSVSFGAERNADPERVMPMVQKHLEDVNAGRLRVVIDREFPLAEAAAAHAYIESRQAFGRVVLRVT
ncbi:MAG TPA: zinc-binding dehydrogenase [Dehalococcoidia bacterium]|nr:zinc-binding dehydrogenase [Dehalococcoidia bacterium]